MKKISAIFFLFLCAALAASADVPLSYYEAANGKKKDILKTSLHTLIQPQTVLSYGSGSASTWSGFYQTDRMDDGEVRDRYSNDHRYFAAGSSAAKCSAITGMNIEHSFPKSWWGGDTNNAYKDLFNLMPCESSINQSKSNYAMGIVVNPTTDNGCTKVGKGYTSGNTSKSLWEPADRWKGDFARAYMYMATTYSHLTWEKEGLTMLVQGDYPTLQPWAYELLVKWNKEDPVDDIEVARNEAVYKIQGNRNPFVDFPHLADYIWGDSIAYAFDLKTTFKAGGCIEGGTDEGPYQPNVDEDGNVLDIESLIALCDGTSVATGAKLGYKFENLLVTYTAGKYIFVYDGKSAFLLYGTNSKSLRKGDIISGRITGATYFHYSLPEMTFDNLNEVVIISRDNEVLPKILTINDVMGVDRANHYSALVKIEGIQPTSESFESKKLTFTDNQGNELLVFDTWQKFTDASFSTTESYDILCIPIIYYKTIEAYPISITPSSESGIQPILTDEMGSKGVQSYDLSGRPNHNTQGLFIVGGRKVIR